MMSSIFRRNAPRWLAYGAAVLIGLTMILWAFPPDKLLGVDALHGLVFGDSSQHIVGQRAFLMDRWRWPLLNTQLLMPPAGVNIGLTDSIPLAALTAKLFRHWLPFGFEAIFPWLAFCWFMQPVAAVFALRGAGEKRLWPAIAASVISISIPTLLWRAGHAGLSSHFLLLIGLGLYFRITHHRPGALWAGAALMPVSLLIHPYLLPMCASIVVAAPITLFWRRDRFWRLSGAVFIGGAALTVGLIKLLGYSNAEVSGGFGVYSMNMISPFYPQESWLVPGNYPAIDVTGGQYEGYQYLGVGLIGLLAVLLLTRFRALAAAARRHVGLFLVCVGLTLFAGSNRMYFGHTPILLARAPHFIMQLRATGRFFWPVTYTIAIGGVALLARSFKPRWGMALLTIIAALQFSDTYAQREGFSLYMRMPTPWRIDAAALKPIIAAHRSLSIWPGAFCWMRPETPALIQSLLLAVNDGVPADTMYLSRASSVEGCPTAASMAAPLPPDELKLFLPNSPQAAILEMPDAEKLCRRVGDLVACSQKLADRRDLPVFAPKSVLMNRPLETHIGAEGAALLGDGWWLFPDQPARVARPDARIVLPCAAGASPASVTLKLLDQTSPETQMTAYIVGTTAGPFALNGADMLMTVPAGACRSGVVTVALHFSGLASRGVSGVVLEKMTIGSPQ